MKYENLHQLIHASSSTYRYFLFLPVKMQMALHQHNKYIHTAQELHQRVHALEAYDRQIALSTYYKRS